MNELMFLLLMAVLYQNQEWSEERKMRFIHDVIPLIDDEEIITEFDIEAMRKEFGDFSINLSFVDQEDEP